MFLVKNINNKRCCIKKISILLYILYHKFIMMYFKFGSSLAYMFVCPLSTTQFSTILKIINTNLIPINSKVKKIIQNGTNGISWLRKNLLQLERKGIVKWYWSWKKTRKWRSSHTYTLTDISRPIFRQKTLMNSQRKKKKNNKVNIKFL